MPEQCKKTVHYGSGVRSAQCSRGVWKDGYCKQHHPDSVKTREAKRRSKWDIEHRLEQLIFKLETLRHNCLDVVMRSSDPEAKKLAEEIRAVENALAIDRGKLEKLK